MTHHSLIMTLLVRDEEDIIAENIAFHHASGVDHFIVTDNLSTDATPKILENLADQGLVTVIHEPEDTYDQHAWVTRMARLAATEFGAEWVINSDADEFWIAGHGSLKEFFTNLPPEINAVYAARHDFAFCYEHEGPWHQRMIWRKAKSLNHIGKPLPPKVAHRAHPDIAVGQGNHSVHGLSPLNAIREGLDILHFPARSVQQFERKIANGGAAYERNTKIPPTVARGWRQLYERLRKEGTLLPYLKEYGYSNEQLRAALRDGSLIKDRRIADFVADGDFLRRYRLPQP